MMAYAVKLNQQEKASGRRRHLSNQIAQGSSQGESDIGAPNSYIQDLASMSNTGGSREGSIRGFTATASEQSSVERVDLMAKRALASGMNKHVFVPPQEDDSKKPITKFIQSNMRSNIKKMDSGMDVTDEAYHSVLDQKSRKSDNKNQRNKKTSRPMSKITDEMIQMNQATRKTATEVNSDSISMEPKRIPRTGPRRYEDKESTKVNTNDILDRNAAQTQASNYRNKLQ